MTAPVQTGEVIAGKYEVERIIGEGGMGVVVAAMHQQLNQRVALKLLRSEGTPDPDASERFFREARAAVKLRSEHVAKVLDVGKLDNQSPYIVMEYLDGEDLGSIAKTGKLGVSDAVSYILQACEALAEAHAAGIIHRDLKPENLFLTRRSDGSPCIKVLDFGISKMTEQGVSNLTTTGSLMGTPLYMSPEQLRSSKQIDARSDIWALGMILYKLLTGEVAFYRHTLPELCAAILLDDLVPPTQLVPGLPEGVDRAIRRALEKSPDDRFPSLAEFTAALTPYARNGRASAERVASILDIKVGPLPVLTRSSAPPPDPMAMTNAADAADLPPLARVSSPGAQKTALPTDQDDPVAGLPASRARPVALAVGAALLAVGLGAFLMSRSSRTDATPPPAPTSAALVASALDPVPPPPPATSLPQVAVLASAPPTASLATPPAASSAPATSKLAPRSTATAAPPPTTKSNRPADFGSRQ